MITEMNEGTLSLLEQLKLAMRRQGVSQEVLADRLAVSRNMLSMSLNGGRDMTLTGFGTYIDELGLMPVLVDKENMASLTVLIRWADGKVEYEVDIEGGVKVFHGQTNELIHTNHCIHKALLFVKNKWNDLKEE